MKKRSTLLNQLMNFIWVLSPVIACKYLINYTEKEFSSSILVFGKIEQCMHSTIDSAHINKNWDTRELCISCSHF